MPRVKEPKERSRTVRYPAALDAWIERRASQAGLTVSEFLRLLAANEFYSQEGPPQ